MCILVLSLACKNFLSAATTVALITGGKLPKIGECDIKWHLVTCDAAED